MNLTAYRTAIYQKLDDVSKTRYTDAQVDDALRMALIDYNNEQDLVKTATVATTGAARISLSGIANASSILQVEYDPTGTVYTAKSACDFKTLFINGVWIIETYYNSAPIPNGKTITVTYTARHTIEALDSATITSILPWHENALATGAAGYALLTRSASRTESINLNQNVSKELRELAAIYLKEFTEVIKASKAAGRVRLPLSETAAARTSPPTLASYRALVLDLIDDEEQLKYSNADIDNATRFALQLLSRISPRSITIPCTATGQIRISPEITAVEITRAEYKPGAASYAEYTQADSLPFHAYQVGSNWFVELTCQNAPIPDNQTLYLTCNIEHTLNGLDSATLTTIPAHLELPFAEAIIGFMQNKISKIESLKTAAAAGRNLLVRTEPSFTEPTGF